MMEKAFYLKFQWLFQFLLHFIAHFMAWNVISIRLYAVLLIPASELRLYLPH